ncbi:MAG: hypothetical protein ACTSRU_20055 [Candidatus Hodarchaeales archaeon]
MNGKHRIKIEGCPNGLGNETPELPDVICTYPCDWRINATKFLNCAWIAFASGPERNKISLREMGKMLGMTHESVRSLLEEAKKKLPKTEEAMEKLFGELDHNNIRRTGDKQDVEFTDALARLLND